MFSVNRNQLKYLVIIAMLLDHIAWGFVPLNSFLGQGMHFLGRLTGPAMAFFLAEGYMYTRNVKKYALRMGIFALISWVPYCLFETGMFPRPSFGVIYTLFLGLLTIWMWDKAKLPRWVKVLGVAFMCVLSFWGDWVIFDVIVPLLLYQYRDSKVNRNRVFYVASFIGMVYCWYCVGDFLLGLYNIGVMFSALIVCHFYNGEPGRKSVFNKWFFYIFYPAHLLILYLIKIIL